MSMPDINDDALLGDDDELDYDLEKDEEDALLADPDSYENEERYRQSAEDPESDILDIDATVALEEEDQEQHEFRQKIKEEKYDYDGQQQHQTYIKEEEYSDNENEQKERNRFVTERSNAIKRTNSDNIPDSLDNVPVAKLNNNRNFRYQRGNNNRGRGRGKQNNRGPIFTRVGTHPSPLLPQESKTVLINPHFRGNVQVKSDARLIWDANTNSQKYSNAPIAQVGPYQNQFQSQPPVWNTPFNEPPQNFSQAPINPNFQEPPPPFQNNDRQIFGTQVTFNQQQQNQDYRNRPAIPNLMTTPPPNFNNQQRNFQIRQNQQFDYENNRNVNPNIQKPFINQNHPNSIQQIQSNYPMNQNPNYDQPFVNQNSYQPNQIDSQIYPPNQANQPIYDQFPNNQYSDTPYHSNNQFQNSSANQNYNQNFGASVSGFGNQHQQFGGNQFSQQYNRQQFNVNRSNVRQNRPPQNFNKTPPKRRTFEKSVGTSEIIKKKKRSSDFTNLHEVPTVDTPDTTFKEEVPEFEDEETRAYRLKIEEQKKLREKILLEKEERRKLAALKQETMEETKTTNLVNMVKDKLVTNEPKSDPQLVEQQIQKPVLKPKPLINLQQKPLMNIQSRPMVTQKPNQQQMLNQPINRNVQSKPNQQHAPNQPINRNNNQQPIPNQQQMLNQPINRNVHQQPKPSQQQAPNQLINRNINQQPKPNQQQQVLNQPINRNINNRNQNRQMVNRQKPAQNPQNIVRVPQSPQQRKVVSAQPSNLVITQKNELAQPQRIVVLNKNPQKTVPNRRIVLKSNETPLVVNDVSSESSNENLSSFLSTRKVINKDVIAANCTGVDLIQTSVVTVSNLSVGTTEAKLRKLCQGLGPIQNVEMIPNNRQATIRFKNIVSAHKFFKKYQRKIIDLSMIHVSLEAI